MAPRQWTCVRSQYVYLPTVYQTLFVCLLMSLFDMCLLCLCPTVTRRTWVGLRSLFGNLMCKGQFENSDFGMNVCGL